MRERELCIWCVGVCAELRVVGSIIRGHQVSLPPLPEDGSLLLSLPLFPDSGLMRTWRCCIMVALVKLQPLFQQADVSGCKGFLCSFAFFLLGVQCP